MITKKNNLFKSFKYKKIKITLYIKLFIINLIKYFLLTDFVNKIKIINNFTKYIKYH